MYGSSYTMRKRTFSRDVVVLSSVVFASSCGWRPQLEKRVALDGSTSELTAAPVQQIQENPFTLDKCGLPHYCSPCGTHGFHFVHDEVALAVINRVFAEAGYRLQPRYRFDRGGVTFIADGYDPAHHLGYVYASYGNLDLDGFRSWESPVSDLNLLHEADNAEYEHEHELAKELRSILQLVNLTEREDAYRRLLSRDRPGKLSLAEASKVIAQWQDLGEYIAVISHFDTRFAVPDWREVLPADAKELEKIPDPAKRGLLAIALGAKMNLATEQLLARSVRDYITWARSHGL